MSRKRKAPKKLPVIDPKYKSTIIPKLINSIMYDGKKTIDTIHGVIGQQHAQIVTLLHQILAYQLSFPKRAYPQN